MSDTDELNVAKQITEAAVLQLINHWKLDYAPAATVDPNTDQVPTSRAIANYFAGLGRTRRSFDINDRLDYGDYIAIPSDVLAKINNTSQLEIKFEPTYAGVIGNGMPPLFAQTVFDLDLYTLADSVTRDAFLENPLTDHTACLMWIFMNTEDNRIVMLYRFVTLVKITHQGEAGTFLCLTRLRRSVIGSDSVTVDQDPTTAQKNRCRIQRAVCYI